MWGGRGRSVDVICTGGGKIEGEIDENDSGQSFKRRSMDVILIFQLRVKLFSHLQYDFVCVNLVDV